MLDEIGLSKIYRKSVTIANKIYNLAITPEKYNDQIGAKINESFRGILNSAEEGNIDFEMELQPTHFISVAKKNSVKYSTNLKERNIVSDINNWIFYPANLNPEIVVELVKMTNKFYEIDNSYFNHNFYKD